MNYKKDSIELLGYEWQIHSKLDENRVVDNGNFSGSTYTKLNPIDRRDTQKWSFEYSSKRNAYVLRNKYWKRTLKCDLSTGDIYLLSYLEDNDDSNHWTLENMGNGEYIFKNYKNPNMVFENVNNNLRANSRKNTDSQKFKLTKTGVQSTLNGEWKISSKVNNKMIASNTSNNAFVEENSMNDEQNWLIEYVNHKNSYTIKNSKTGKALTWYKQNDNNVIATHYYDDTTQYWFLEDSGNRYYTFRNYENQNKILNLDSNNYNLSVAERRNNDSQKFKLVSTKIQDNIIIGEWIIGSKLNSDKVLDVNNDTSYQNVTIWDKNNGNNQKWIFEYDSNKDAYKIKSAINNNLVLACNDKTVSKNVFVTEFKGYNEHYWKLNDVWNGEYVIESYYANNTGLVLDLFGSNTTNGSNIQLHERRNTDNQKFKLIR